MSSKKIKTKMPSPKPVGYHIQENIPCCANCMFGGYLGDEQDYHRMSICEIYGEPSDSDYAYIAVEPLGLCDVYKPYRLTPHFKERDI